MHGEHTYPAESDAWELIDAEETRDRYTAEQDAAWAWAEAYSGTRYHVVLGVMLWMRDRDEAEARYPRLFAAQEGA